MTRSERRRRFVLSACAINAIVVLFFVIGLLVFRRPLAWNEVLPAFGLQVCITLALVKMIRRQQMRQRALRAASLTIREATRIGIDNVRSEIRDLHLMFSLSCIAIPLLALSVTQLISSGKMNVQGAWSFALVCGLVLGVNAAIQWRRYWRTLTPQRMRLEKILTSLHDEG